MSWRWWPALQGLWPAVLVWLLLILPQLAYSSSRLLAPDTPYPLPWYLRWPLRGLQHVWPYSRIVQFSGRLDHMLGRRSATGMNCTVCDTWFGTISLPQHLLDHFPGEQTAWKLSESSWQEREAERQRQWFTPPSGLTPEQADQWLDARMTTGERPWASTSAGSTSTSRPA